MATRRDDRDDTTWVVVELTRAGEQKVEEGCAPEILRTLLQVEDDYPVFIPAVVYKVGGETTVLNLMQGYAFVQSGLPETQYFRLERDNPYVRKVLTSRSTSGLRVLNTIPNRNIIELRRQMAEHVASDIYDDAHIVVQTGLLMNMEGQVLTTHDESAFVIFKLRSIDIIAAIPKAFLCPIEMGV